MAKLFFRYAAMNAGKSTALLQVAHNYEERGHRVRLFTAQVDDRYGRTGDALDKRQRVARRWAKADADLPLVVDLRKILDEPEEPAIAPPSEPTIEIEGERVSGDDGVEP